MPTPRPSGDDLHVVLARLARAHRAELARRLAPLGLHPGQEQLLGLLWVEDGQGQARLAGELGVEAPTVAKMVTRLEHAGFVERVQDPADGHASQVWLSGQGRDVRVPTQRALRHAERRALRGLSERQVASLRSAAGVVSANLAASPRRRG